MAAVVVAVVVVVGRDLSYLTPVFVELIVVVDLLEVAAVDWFFEMDEY